MPKRSAATGAAFRRTAPVALAALVAFVWSAPVDGQVAKPRSARLPLTFEANAGQTHGDVRFLSRAPGYVLFLTDTEAVLASEASAPLRMRWVDRKSTRLNSSHLVISYAVFCLKKKKKDESIVKI